MNYNELSFIAKNKKITIGQLATEIGLTRGGFKDAIEKKTLNWEKMYALCSILSITPNELLGFPNADNSSNGNFAVNISGGNTQNSNEAILALKDELKEQRAIIKEKDKQINRLLTVIERNKLK